MEGIHDYYLSSSFGAFCIFELIRTIASGMISWFSLLVGIFWLKLYSSKKELVQRKALVDLIQPFLPDIYNGDIYFCGSKNMYVFGRIASLQFGQFQVYNLVNFKSILLFTFNLVRLILICIRVISIINKKNCVKKTFAN